MAGLISYRPTHFNAVVGQTRAIRVTTAVLTTAKFLPRGFILEGVRGVGKTSTAYLMARALMCTEDPLGCGRCASCLTFAEQGIDQHPDFTEVDGASNSGVEHARNIITQSGALPVLGKRRVIMVDEAHNISRLAWDVYLKPLEAKDTNCVFIFVSNEGEKIPETIRSRCAKARFQRLPEEMLLGLLCNCASAHDIPYDLDALKLIAKHTKGIARDAYMILDTVASMGLVTRELVQSVIDTSLEDTCLKIYAHVLRREQAEAVRLCDDLCNAFNPPQVIEAMFEIFGRAVFKPEDSVHDAIRQGFGSVSQVTTILIKWSLSQNIPLDAMALFIYELVGVLEGTSNGTSVTSHVMRVSPPRTTAVQAGEDVLNVRELLDHMGGTRN